MPTILSTRGVQKKMSHGCVLVDVRLREDFDQQHISGAVSNCVFEVAFLSRMPGITETTGAAVCVYGAGPESYESRVAAEKLEQAGYGSVFEYREGLAGWHAAGGETDSGEPLPDRSPPPDGTLPLDLQESAVEWVGRNLLNKHWGTLGMRSGEMVFENGQWTGGSVVLDMKDIVCTDLKGSEMHDVLIAHLASDDFFDVENHPTARYDITSVIAPEGCGEGSLNRHISGSLTLRGQTHPLSFEAAYGLTPRGVPAFQASVLVDRTTWGVRYGSGKFFSRLAGHLVNDHIQLQLRILGNISG